MGTKSKKELGKVFESVKSFKEMAKDSTFDTQVIPTYPGSTFDRPMGRSMRIYSKTMKASVWSKPEHLTLSLLKTDVFDRRFFKMKPITDEEVIKGAFSEANKDYDDMPWIGLTRPKYGVLLESGGRMDYEAWSENYPFPCQKPVGQVIVKSADMKGAVQPGATQHMKNGLTTLTVKNEKGAKMDMEYLLSMTRRNILAVRSEYEGLNDLSFRLYRHMDQGHRRYMDADGNYMPKEERAVVYHPVNPNDPVGYYDYEADADINGPFGEPESGSEGRFFWIRQRFPAEPTFPEGFEYVMMGMLSEKAPEITVQGLQHDLGSGPYIPKDPEGNIIIPQKTIGHDDIYYNMDKAFTLVKDAPGVAATAEVKNPGKGSTVMYVAVVTVNENEDFMAEARRQLLEAEELGFDTLVDENTKWYDDMYDGRESGRIFVPAQGEEKETIDKMMLKEAYLSWTHRHGGYCLPDPRKLEGSAGYAAFDIDTQSWHSLPCYNEIFGEPQIVRNQWEPLMMWLHLLEAWHDALVEKARLIYNVPGMHIAHGYLPPTKPDPWYMENQCLDMCLEVPGQMMKALWAIWDYRGDEELLKDRIYPFLKELAIFYEAFARKHYDGTYYNLYPVVETESWGISYKLQHATNTTGAITMFRKVLNMATEAAEMLGVDEELIPGWQEVAQNLPPYPKFLVGSGEIIAGNPGAMPRWSAGDHEHFSGDYPALLADEINLDSSEEDKELIVRTLDTVRTNWVKLGYILMGRFSEHIPCGYNVPAIKISDYTTLMEDLMTETERMLNSRSGRIYVFPVVPQWSEIAFKDFLARGGFEVSASKDASGIKAVTLKANRNVACNLMNPYPGIPVTVTDLTEGSQVLHKVDTSNGECIIFKAQKGHEYSVDKK